MKKSPANKSGFTLIEIVIVLAIAALIMVIVFVAVQGAQRSRRDTTARNAASQTLAAMEQYASNNSGAYPTAAGQMVASYTTGITPTPVYSAAPVTGPNTINYSSGKPCNGNVLAATGNANNAAVFYWSEASGTAVCINN